MEREQQSPAPEPRPDSGDRSGKGRERRPDEVYPQHRDADEMGTHGGPKHFQPELPEKREGPPAPP